MYTGGWLFGISEPSTVFFVVFFLCKRRGPESAPDFLNEEFPKKTVDSGGIFLE